MKRRDFLKAGSILSAPIILHGIPISSFSRSRFTQMINNDEDKVLVLIQLNGGNDGLNTIIPIDQYEYLSSLRSNILIPESKVVKLEDHVGIHPAMTNLKYMYSNRQLSIIQGVAYANQNRSHFRSTDIWQTGSDANEYLTTGWFGRHLDTEHMAYPDNYPNAEFPDPIAITLGYQLSETCQGIGANYSISLTSETSLQSIDNNGQGNYEQTCYDNQVKFVRQSIQQLNAYSEVVSGTFESGNNLVEYPETKIAQQLRLIAKLISGGSRTKIFVANLGGFDTHANQVEEGNTIEGEHAELLQNLAEAIYAFQSDLDAQNNADRVIGMTYSEFGRRIKSNGSNGSDHGTGAPLLVFGNCASGNILGDNPDLSGEVGNQDGVPMQYDFRSVYASILMDWFGADEMTLRDLIFNDFQHLPIITSCSSTSVAENIKVNMKVKVFPNPTAGIVQVEVDKNLNDFSIELYDVLGTCVWKKAFSQSNNPIEIDIHSYAPGNYFVRVMNCYQSTKMVQNYTDMRGFMN